MDMTESLLKVGSINTLPQGLRESIVIVGFLGKRQYAAIPLSRLTTKLLVVCRPWLLAPPHSIYKVAFLT